jgi:hypothetical protein
MFGGDRAGAHISMTQMPHAAAGQMKDGRGGDRDSGNDAKDFHPAGCFMGRPTRGLRACCTAVSGQAVPCLLLVVTAWPA